jgi:uncharacterized protein
MQRRGFFKAFAAVSTGVLAAMGGARAAPAPGKAKVAYHLADLDRVAFVLGNLQNHLDGVGGPEKIDLVLVVHGPALKAFHSISADPQLTQRVAGMSKAGVGLNACGNTMKAQKVSEADLLPGFVTVAQGGVVRLAELQAQGYAYLRP